MTKKSRWIFLPLVIGMMMGCSTKENTLSSNIKEHAIKNQDVGTTKKSVDDLAVEVKPLVDKKLEVVTKVKPEVAILDVQKVDSSTTPMVVVDPVEANGSVDVKKVEVLPVVDDTLGVVTEVEPTIEVVEDIPVEGEEAAVVIEPVVE